MTITAGKPFQAERHVPPARRTWPAQISRISHSFRAENVTLSISISKQASAQRSGISPSGSVASNAASATARARSMAPALHSAAASTTSLLTRCRADAPSDRGHRLGQLDRFGRHGGRPTGRRRWPSPTRRPPIAGAPGAGRRTSAGTSAESARVNNVAAAAKRPTPSASAASPISASARASGSAPASASARPSQPRASVCQPSWRKNDPCVLWASETNRPAGPLRRRRPGHRRRCRSGLARPTQRHATTIDVAWSPPAAASWRVWSPKAAAASVRSISKCDEFQSQ